MENKDQNMEILDSEALKNVSGGGIKEAYEYMESLMIKYGAGDRGTVLLSPFICLISLDQEK